MNNYEKDSTEILDIPVVFHGLGSNTISNPEASSSPSGLTFTPTVSADGKKATLLVGGGTYPNVYDCKVYFDISDGAKRAARFTITMIQ